jgi:hypothetical protein
VRVLVTTSRGVLDRAFFKKSNKSEEPKQQKKPPIKDNRHRILTKSMFITNFKRVIRSFPPEEAGHEALVAHISNKDTVIDPIAEFFTRITRYALEKTQAPALATGPNPRMLMAALVMKRFPVEMLQTPEEPLQFTLLNKAENLLETIDSILREHNPTEDDTAPDLIPAVTTTLFLTALVEYHAAWTDWSAYDAAILDARIETGLQRLRGGLVDTGVISG